MAGNFTCMEDTTNASQFRYENLKDTEHYEDLDADESVIFKQILKDMG
jgi:hypothetical protein